MTKEIERFCGNCCWFFGECTDGDGCCSKHYLEEPKNGRDPMLTRCDKKACMDFLSNEEKRHHLAVLIQHNRWIRSDEVPNHCRMVNPTELGKAIDFVCEYVKIYNRL